jgi:hypothetical protein
MFIIGVGMKINLAAASENVETVNEEWPGEK